MARQRGGRPSGRTRGARAAPKLRFPDRFEPLPQGLLDVQATVRWLAREHLLDLSPAAVQAGIHMARDPALCQRLAELVDLPARAGGPCTGTIIRGIKTPDGRGLSPAGVVTALLWVWQANGRSLGHLAHRPWALAAQALAAPPATAETATAREGWLVLVIDPYDITLKVQWLAKRDRRPLKLRPMKATDAVDDVILAPTPAEREAWAHAQRQASARHTWQSAAVDAARGALLRLAPRLREVRFEDDPIQVEQAQWRPTLRVTRDGDGLLQAVAGPAPLWISDPGDWVVVDGALRPAGPSLRVLWSIMLGVDEWRFSPELIDEFAADVLTRIDTPIEVDDGVLSLIPGVPKPRLQVAVEGPECLSVDAAFRYGELDITPAHGGLLAGPGGLIQRDAAHEAALRAELSRTLEATGANGDLPARLVGDDAWRFLGEVEARLPGWTVEADRDLVSKLRGPLRPRVQINDATDWFDLKVDFQLDGADVGLRQILEAWRAQRQFVVLKGGQVAELPTAWLEQHGDSLEALEDLRRAGKKRLGTPAAHVARDLLAEVDAKQAAAAQRWLAVADRLRQFDQVPDRDPPSGLKATLRPYQHGGYRWLAFLRELGLGGVLADDMGLGKTVQTLALLLDGRPTARHPDLVVAPTSVIHNWALEAQRFAPDLRVHLHHGPKRGEPPRDVDLVVTSYALLRLDRAAALAGPWHTAVLDEAQHIKNPASAITKAAHALDARHRFALTGTPLENHLLELWSIVGFVAPGLFGSRKAFAERYARPIAQGDEQGQRRLAELRQRMRPFLLRRLKREVATELPPRQEQILAVELGPKQARLYAGLRDAYRAEVLDAVQVKGVGKSKLKVLEALLRLRQAACEPSLLPKALAQGLDQSAKREVLAELLPTLADEGHRSLVFSQWPGFLKRVAKDLEAQGLGYLYLDGSTRDRATLQARWNAPDGPPFFLISIKAGGTGLNLVAADHVIHLDPWWNPAVEQQATDRAHRIGQDKPVLVYKLVAQGTVEEKIIELQAKKRDLFDQAVDADRVGVEQLTAADLHAVFG